MDNAKTDFSPISYIRHRLASVIDNFHGARLISETARGAPPSEAEVEFAYGGRRYVVRVTDAGPDPEAR